MVKNTGFDMKKEVTDLEGLLQELQIGIGSMPHSGERERLLDMLKEIRELKPISYQNLTPEQAAKLLREDDVVTGKALEIIALQYPEIYETVARIDPQTKLYSKTYFEKHVLPDTIMNADKNGVPVAYLLLDLDDFHKFNEAYGHTHGDEAIEFFSKSLKHIFRTNKRRGRESAVAGNKRSVATEDY